MSFDLLHHSPSITSVIIFVREENITADIGFHRSFADVSNVIGFGSMQMTTDIDGRHL